jgi:hypothetical protein
MPADMTGPETTDFRTQRVLDMVDQLRAGRQVSGGEVAALLMETLEACEEAENRAVLRLQVLRVAAMLLCKGEHGEALTLINEALPQRPRRATINPA